MLSVTLKLLMLCRYPDCRYAECRGAVKTPELKNGGELDLKTDLDFRFHFKLVHLSQYNIFFFFIKCTSLICN
jgi:hypothetical protein